MKDEVEKLNTDKLNLMIDEVRHGRMSNTQAKSEIRALMLELIEDSTPQGSYKLDREFLIELVEAL